MYGVLGKPSFMVPRPRIEPRTPGMTSRHSTPERKSMEKVSLEIELRATILNWCFIKGQKNVFNCESSSSTIYQINVLVGG